MDVFLSFIYFIGTFGMILMSRATPAENRKLKVFGNIWILLFLFDGTLAMLQRTLMNSHRNIYLEHFAILRTMAYTFAVKMWFLLGVFAMPYAWAP